MPEPVAALVVGAGPAGSATALRLARAGHRVLMIDKARLPRDKCCSEYLSPQTIHEIAALGVPLDSQLDNHTALAGTVIHGPSGSIIEGLFRAARPAPPASHGVALPRLKLDAMLLAAASEAGAEVRDQTRLLDLHRRADGLMCATIETGGRRETLTARVVVGADGIRSRVARAAGLSNRGGVDRIAFVAHLQGVRGMTTLAELHVGRRGYIGLNPIDAGVTNVAVVVPAHLAAGARGDARGFFARSIASSGVAKRLAATTVIREVMTSGPFDCRATSSTADGVALVGDAADFFDPFTGDGIRSAVVGARLLSGVLDRLLAEARAITHEHLREYRLARRREFLGKWIFERVLGHAMRWPALFDASMARLHRAHLDAMLVGVAGGFVPAGRLMAWNTARRIAWPGPAVPGHNNTGITTLG